MITLLHLTRADDVMCFKCISFLFLVKKKRLEVNVGENIILNIKNKGNNVLMKTLMIPSLSNETNGDEF